MKNIQEKLVKKIESLAENKRATRIDLHKARYKAFTSLSERLEVFRGLKFGTKQVTVSNSYHQDYDVHRIAFADTILNAYPEYIEVELTLTVRRNRCGDVHRMLPWVANITWTDSENRQIPLH